jgi:hypothetical protein
MLSLRCADARSTAAFEHARAWPYASMSGWTSHLSPIAPTGERIAPSTSRISFHETSWVSVKPVTAARWSPSPTAACTCRVPVRHRWFAPARLPGNVRVAARRISPVGPGGRVAYLHAALQPGTTADLGLEVTWRAPDRATGAGARNLRSTISNPSVIGCPAASCSPSPPGPEHLPSVTPEHATRERVTGGARRVPILCTLGRPV